MDSDSLMGLGDLGPDSELGGGDIKTPPRKRRRPFGEMVIIGMISGALMHQTPSRDTPLVLHINHVAHFERSA